jgi:DNA-binding MarR family transcriptional regulator
VTSRAAYAIFDLHRAVHTVGLALDAIPNARVTQAEAFILAYLHGRRKVSMGELHRAFGHRRSTLTAVVARLVERGLASRAANAHDRRSIVVNLSPSGAALAHRLYRTLAKLQDAAFRDMAEGDLATFKRVLAQLMKASEGM